MFSYHYNKFSIFKISNLLLRMSLSSFQLDKTYLTRIQVNTEKIQIVTIDKMLNTMYST